LPERWRFTRPFSYFSRGLYASLLEPYFNSFMEHQVLVVRYEDIRERPAELSGSLHRFLGVTLRPDDAEGLGVVNPSVPEPNGPDERVERVRRELIERYAEPNRRLAELLGPSFQMWS